MNFAPYPLVRHFLCFAAGIGGYLYTQYFDNSFYIAFAILIVGLIVFTLRFTQRLIRGLITWLLFFVFGWILTFHSTPSNEPNHYIHETVFDYYRAVITSNTEVKPKTYKVAAEIKALKINGEWQSSDGKVLLYFPLDIAEKPLYGDTFLIRAMPREVEAPKNPYEFDYRTYLFRKGTYAHHFLRENDFEKTGATNPGVIYGFANGARMRGNAIFREFLKDPETYSIADAMVLGLRDELDRDLRGAYAAAGAVHILAVSGMHVGIVFLLLQLIFGQRRNSKNKRTKAWFALLVIVCLFSYALLAGLSASVVRATVMFSFIQLAPLFNREQNIFNTLALSAICLLCWNPYWLLDVGFQLSYLAVFGIVLVYPHANRLIFPQNLILRWLWQISAVSFSAQLFTFPLSIYYFHQFPNYFLLTNPLVTIAAIAIMPLGLFLLALHFVPHINNVLALFLESAIHTLNKIVFFINDLPNSVSQNISISALEALLLYGVIICLAVFLLRKNFKSFALATIIIIALCGWNIFEDTQQSNHQEMTLHFIPKKSGITLLDGKQAVFVSDKSIKQDPRLYDFHLKNYYDSKGISNYEVFNPNPLSAVINIDFENFALTWVREQPNKIMSNPAPLLLISNNAIRNLSENFKDKLPTHIIIDDSNKKYVVEKLTMQALELGIEVTSLYEQGSVTIVE